METRLSVPAPVPVLFLIDPDASSRHALFAALSGDGGGVTAFPSAEDFLDAARITRPACLITALRLPGRGGEWLLEHLLKRQIDIPVIFTATEIAVPEVVRLMRRGAADVHLKPLDVAALRRAVADAHARDIRTAAHHQETEWARQRLAALTPRERELFALFAEGLSYKEIAARLGISRRTVENHRAHLNIKLGHEHVTDFVRLSILAHADDVPVGAAC